MIENVVHALWKAQPSTPTAAAGNTIAWLGPCIGPQAFEVGDEVRQTFVADHPECSALFRPHAPGKWLADLPGLARDRLAAAGVERVSGGRWCTFAQTSRFFSYRRNRITGRMAAAVWIEPGRG